MTDSLTTARRLLVGAQRAADIGDSDAALELAIVAAQYLRLAKLFAADVRDAGPRLGDIFTMDEFRRSERE